MERKRESHELSFFAEYSPEQFTQEEEKILQLFFSNTNRPVFAVSDLPPTVIGALIARHSASEKSMRRAFLDEFVASPEMAEKLLGERQILTDFLDIPQAGALLERNWVGYGHDSLGAAMPLVFGFESISQLGVKGVEDTRIGLGPIERSTRYGFFGAREGGRYVYARPPEIMRSAHARLYEEEIDANLALYAQLQEPVATAYREKLGGASERKIRRMTFDAIRVLLVAANLTNFGAMVNAQALEHMVIKLKASQLEEHRALGTMLEEETAQLDPVLVERIQSDQGQQAVDYLAEREKRMTALSSDLFRDVKSEETKRGPVLVSFDPEGEIKVITKILRPHSDLPDHQLLEFVRRLSLAEKGEIVNAYLGERLHRGIKPGRALEEATLSCQLVCRFAEWRDLQRHRILTPYWGIFDCRLGFDVGGDLWEFGFGAQVEQRLEQLAEVQAKIAADYPAEAQYMLPFGALVPYWITLNLRELVHIAELRTGPGAHEGYAQIASEMAEQAVEAYPLLARAFQFVSWR